MLDPVELDLNRYLRDCDLQAEEEEAIQHIMDLRDLDYDEARRIYLKEMDDALTDAAIEQYEARLDAERCW